MSRLAGAGYVLAGGESRRMGSPKGLLRYQGRSYLQRAVDTLGSLGLPVTIVARAGQSFPMRPARVIPDVIERAGPLGGLYTALLDSPADQNYLLACDLPLMTAELFVKLSPFADQADAVIPRDGRGQLQPLAACYLRGCLPVVRDLLEEGERRLEAVAEQASLRIRLIDTAALGISDRIFLNINRPEDLAELKDEGGKT